MSNEVAVPHRDSKLLSVARLNMWIAERSAILPLRSSSVFTYTSELQRHKFMFTSLVPIIAHSHLLKRLLSLVKNKEIEK